MVRSTFAAFTTAQLAMAASQKALDVTGQNIANINTTGYTRQRLDISSLNTHGADYANSLNQAKVGYGVQITGVSQLRDPFLDAQYRNQIARLGTTDAIHSSLEQLETVFDETTRLGLKNAISQLSSNLQTLSSQAGNKEFDSMVRSSCQVLIDLFHQNAADLDSIREDLIDSLDKVDNQSINDLLKELSELNQTIKNSQILGNPALELQDQRNTLLDELASYLPISVEYTEEAYGPSESQNIQVMHVTFHGSDGSQLSLIDDDKFGSIRFSMDNNSAVISITDSEGNGPNDVTDILKDGTLKGSVDFLNEKGAFSSSELNGFGYYRTALDSLVATFAETFNELNRAPQLDGDGKVILGADGKPVLIERNLFEKIDPSQDWSASNIKISDDWINGTYGLTTSVIPDANGQIGSSANDNILAFIDALETDRTFSDGSLQGNIGTGTQFFKGNFYDCFTNIENTLGIDISSASTTLTNQISVLNQTADSRDSISGVSLDEEGMNLMHYQQSYTAAARFMTTIDETLDILINSTGIVGR